MIRVAFPARRTLRWWLLALLVLAFILIPFVFFGGAFDRLSTASLKGAPPEIAAAMVVVLLSADVVLPLPSSVISTFSGVAVGPVLGSIANWLGMTVSCVIGYWIGRSGGGLLIHTSKEGRPSAQRGSPDFGLVAVVAARAVPVLAEATIVMAGATRLPFSRFFIATTLANAGVGTLYASVGASMGEGAFWGAFFASLLLPALALVLHRVLLTARKTRSE